VALPPAVAALPLRRNGSWPIPSLGGRLLVLGWRFARHDTAVGARIRTGAGEIRPSRQIAGRRGGVPQIMRDAREQQPAS
jgi:hypothetical protein